MHMIFLIHTEKSVAQYIYYIKPLLRVLMKMSLSCHTPNCEELAFFYYLFLNIDICQRRRSCRVSINLFSYLFMLFFLFNLPHTNGAELRRNPVNEPRWDLV